MACYIFTLASWNIKIFNPSLLSASIAIGKDFFSTIVCAYFLSRKTAWIWSKVGSNLTQFKLLTLRSL